MDNPNASPKSVHLLDDLESIRQLLGDDTLQPPLLTETVEGSDQIPMLFEQIDEPVVTPPPPPPAPPKVEPKVEARPDPIAKRQEALLHLDVELRAAAQLIMQDVIDDFAPHIENEIKRRLDVRMEWLLSQYPE
ncbi:DNA polymerase III subunit chi [Pseudomonas sp. LS1212]|uniref:DNA polymerase III subunit chi n=1 Tax=Pseudomonas sp. LS1212 TaxID=2972478 RepID=UPI00215BA24D|nr:DNA polymerase III subunit chi [Pseudomonas sp. LS1212]UVJ44923.1 DNA polymerase III subunit chi [Pseudomonas sp. LS1212]